MKVNYIYLIKQKYIYLFIFWTDELTFKSKRYRNDSKLKLKVYINDLLEDEMIACCEHGLMNRNSHHYLFQIQSITGAKPCDK